MNITQIDQQIEKLNKQKQKILDKQKSQGDWLSISKTEEINIKQQFNNQTYSEILKQLKPNERIADYPLLQRLRNEEKLPINFWVFVPNLDRISEKNNYVARFYAYSGGADFYCYWDPTNADASLGVFVVRKKINSLLRGNVKEQK